MPTYPIESDKLLEAADSLAPQKVGRGRPPYTFHRRAVSTAYYATFHAISGQAVKLAFPTTDELFRQRARRWIEHADVAKVCRWVSGLQGTGGYTVPDYIRKLLAPTGGTPWIDAATVTIAEGFLELYDKRLEADYNHEAVFARADTLGHIALARQVVNLVETVTSPESRAFLGLIAMQSRIKDR